MIIYRPHRGRLDDAMKESVEFKSLDDMKQYIEEYWDGYIKAEDIVLSESSWVNKKNGWKDERYVCTKKTLDKDYIEMYKSPQCIGMCATDY